MPTSTPADAIEVFTAAKNLNAALKNVIKKEADQNAGVERFAKSFRAAASLGMSNAAKAFVQKHFEGNEPLFSLVARYAHAEVVAPLAEQIVTAYGDVFNATFTRDNGTLILTDEKKFHEIVKAVIEKVDARIKETSLPANAFMKQTVYDCVFDTDVLEVAFGN